MRYKSKNAAVEKETNSLQEQTREDQQSLSESNEINSHNFHLVALSTESQREIWNSAKMSTEASLAFNESISLQLRGSLDIKALQQAFELLVERHELLRSVFSRDGMTFCVHKQLKIEIPIKDLSQTKTKDKALNELLTKEVEIPFNLEQGPLIRAQILILSESEHLLVITAHHIICDGWSYAVILKDLAKLYNAEKNGGIAKLDPVDPFHLYAKQMEERALSSDYKADQAFWLNEYQTTPTRVDLPSDRLRPVYKTYASQREDYTLDAGLIKQLKKTGAGQGCSFMQTLLAGFEVLLYRLTKQEDIVIFVAAAGQASTGQKNLVGHCVNTLPLRNTITGNSRFSDFLKFLRSKMLDAYEHQQYTYGTLLHDLNIPRDPSRLPLCSVLFNLDQALDTNQLGFASLSVEMQSNSRRYENFELFVNAVEVSGAVVLEVQYNRDLFDAGTIHHYMVCFETLLRGIVADLHQEIARLPLLSLSDQTMILLNWNETHVTYPNEATVDTLFSQQAALTPDRIAVQFENNAGLSYRALEQQSNQLARYLQNQGIAQGALVGLYVDRSLEMLIATLAIMKTGAAYVPLDPSYPKQRIELMIKDSQLTTLVSQSWLVGHLAAEYQTNILLLDKAAKEISVLVDTPVTRTIDSEAAAYVIYTSGSTGVPKGVVVPHRALVNFLMSMARKPGIKANDIVLAVTTLSFDIAVLELYLPITTGAKTVIASRATATDGNALFALLKKSGATLMQATPATWRLLITAGWKDKEQLGAQFKVLCGGEALSRDLAGQILARAGSLWNMYGPTETTVWSMCKELVSAELPITIGQPIGNTQIYVLDQLLQPVPVGVQGELYIGGSGVSLGYLHQPGLSAQRFIDNPYFDPFADYLSPHLYKTGDLVRYLADGSVEYIGRADNQVKVRGYRIELSEIETQTAMLAGVQQAVVIVRDFGQGDMRIISYLKAKPGFEIDIDMVQQQLKEVLPEFMIPQHQVILDEFPHTQNGKIDHKALPDPLTTNDADDFEAFEPPQTESEIIIANLWRELLQIDDISVHDNFFNIGGHSLLSMQFITRLEKMTGFQMNARMVLLNNLAQLAQQVPSNNDEKDESMKLTVVAPDQEISFRRLLNRIRNGFRNKKEVNEQDLLRKKGAATDRFIEFSPTSLMQERIWRLCQIDLNSTAYNLPAAFRIKGPYDINAIINSLNEIIKRHDILRTIIIKNDPERIEQKITLSLVLSLNPIDLSHLPSTFRDTELMNLLKDESSKPFDLIHGPLIKIQLYQLSQDELVLFLMPHHLIWDGWSFDIFLRELAVLYEAYHQGKTSPLPALELQYGDFARWQRQQMEGCTLAKDREFWFKQLAEPLPHLEFKSTSIEKVIPDFSGAMQELSLNKELVDALITIGRQEGVTLSIVLLAAYQVLLNSYTNQNDIIVGLPVLGRDQPTIQNLIGYFINVLPIRTRFKTGLTFRQLLNQVQDTVLNAYQHQEMSYAQVLYELGKMRNANYDTLIQAGFSYQDASKRRTLLADLELSQFNLHSQGVANEISLWFKLTNEGLTGAIEYRTNLFDPEMINNMAKDLVNMLEKIKVNLEVQLSQLIPNEKLKPEQVHQPVETALISQTKHFTKPLNPFYFESNGQQIFGIYHPPRARVQREVALLLCNPIGHEYVRSHWAIHQLTKQLVLAGFPVLRFDYFATGDSHGDFQQGSINQWKSDIIAAANQLMLISAKKKISIIGLRFGASLASLVTQEGLKVEDLILWDPVLNGTNYLEEIKSMQSELIQRVVKETKKPYFGCEGEQADDIIGFIYSQALQKQIATLDFIWSGAFNSQRTVIISTKQNDPKLNELSLFSPEVNIQYLADVGKWDQLDDTSKMLITPLVFKAVLRTLIGRKS